METKWLEDFVSLAETRSFSRSAQLRHVTQPAFSRRIQSLEAWAGADLVDRNGQLLAADLLHYGLYIDPREIWDQAETRRSLQAAMPDLDLIGLGVSAIGRVGPQYVQNVKEVGAYQDALAQGRFPIERGLALSRDDLLRRSVIMALMCQGRVEFESVELAHLIDFRSYFEPELNALRAFAEQGMLRIEARALALTDLAGAGGGAAAACRARDCRYTAMACTSSSDTLCKLRTTCAIGPLAVP